MTQNLYDLLEGLWPHVSWGHMHDSIQIIVSNSHKIHQNMWVEQPLKKTFNQRLVTPRWPLTPLLLWSHVWLYPRIIVSQVSYLYRHMYVLEKYIQNEWSHSLFLSLVQEGETDNKGPHENNLGHISGHHFILTKITNSVLKIHFTSRQLSLLKWNQVPVLVNT